MLLSWQKGQDTHYRHQHHYRHHHYYGFTTIPTCWMSIRNIRILETVMHIPFVLCDNRFNLIPEGTLDGLT